MGLKKPQFLKAMRPLFENSVPIMLMILMLVVVRTLRSYHESPSKQKEGMMNLEESKGLLLDDMYHEHPIHRHHVQSQQYENLHHLRPVGSATSMTTNHIRDWDPYPDDGTCIPSSFCKVFYQGRKK